MEKLIFEVRGNVVELIEQKDLFGEDVIAIFENTNYIGSIEKLHKHEIHITAQRILSGKFSYQEIGVYA